MAQVLQSESTAISSLPALACLLGTRVLLSQTESPLSGFSVCICVAQVLSWSGTAWQKNMNNPPNLVFLPKWPFRDHSVVSAIFVGWNPHFMGFGGIFGVGVFWAKLSKRFLWTKKPRHRKFWWSFVFFGGSKGQVKGHLAWPWTLLFYNRFGFLLCFFPERRADFSPNMVFCFFFKVSLFFSLVFLDDPFSQSLVFLFFFPYSFLVFPCFSVFCFFSCHLALFVCIIFLKRTNSIYWNWKLSFINPFVFLISCLVLSLKSLSLCFSYLNSRLFFNNQVFAFQKKRQFVKHILLVNLGVAS